MGQSDENKVIIDGQTYYGGLNLPNLKFVKLNVDCWEKIFDRLSLRDIIAMSQTCQRMRQIGGHYFRENFHGYACNLHIFGAIFLQDGTQIKIGRIDFVRFIDTAYISRPFRYLTQYLSDDLLRSLTTLRLRNIRLNETELHGYENVLNQIGTVYFKHCLIYKDFIGEFLDLCPKLKCLRLKDVHFRSTLAKSNVFQRKFTMLEDFQYIECKNSTPGFVSFLKRNPSIKCVRIGADDLCEIPYDTSTIQLDWLVIRIDSDENTNAVELANRLKTLHTNGCYRKLGVVLTGKQTIDEAFIDEMRLFNALKLSITHNFYANIRHLTGLKKLHIRMLSHAVDIEPIAKQLINLQRLWIKCTLDQLLTLFRCSMTLKTVNFFDRGSHENALQLLKLSQVRRMGGMKHKITIGLTEKQYLATIWNEKNVNYDLVEVIRVETIRKFDNLFGC